jgi:uncharacterized protein
MPVTSFFRSLPGLVLIIVILAAGASLPVAFGFERSDPLGMVLLTLSALVFFLAAPLALIHYGFKESISEYGWRLPHNLKEAFLYGILALAVLLLPLLFLASLPQFQNFYRLGEGMSLTALLLVFPLTALYFVAEEFLFRGFFFFALRKKYGLYAIAIDALVFGLLHFDKPALEMFFAMAAAAVLSGLTLKTGSSLPAALVHFVMATILTLVVTL